MLRSSVDFPAPENPMMPWMLPRLMCRLTSSTAVNLPPAELNDVLTFWIWITGHHRPSALALPWSACSWFLRAHPRKALCLRHQGSVKRGLKVRETQWFSIGPGGSTVLKGGGCCGVTEPDLSAARDGYTMNLAHARAA